MLISHNKKAYNLSWKKNVTTFDYQLVCPGLQAPTRFCQKHLMCVYDFFKCYFTKFMHTVIISDNFVWGKEAHLSDTHLSLWNYSSCKHSGP